MLLRYFGFSEDQTLRGVAMQYLGNFDRQRLHQIRALNRNLIDPDRIEAGQKLRLPRSQAATVAKIATSSANIRRLP
jgi:hypothetical protein